jgi:hypothetical protein
VEAARPSRCLGSILRKAKVNVNGKKSKIERHQRNKSPVTHRPQGGKPKERLTQTDFDVMRATTRPRISMISSGRADG